MKDFMKKQALSAQECYPTGEFVEDVIGNIYQYDPETQIFNPSDKKQISIDIKEIYLKKTEIVVDVNTISMVNKIVKELTKFYMDTIRISKEIKPFTDGLHAFNNGVLNYRTGEFRSLQREDYLSHKETYDYDKDIEEAPEIFQRLIKDRCESEEVYEDLLQFIGYHITNEQEIPVIHVVYDDDVGFTGKTTLMLSITKLIGDNFTKNVKQSLFRPISDQQLYSSYNNKKFVYKNDTKENEINWGWLKDFTDFQKITTRKLYTEKEITTRIGCGFWITTNHIPNTFATDNGVLRRLKYWKFNKKVNTNKLISASEIKDEEIGKMVSLCLNTYFKRGGNDGIHISMTNSSIKSRKLMLESNPLKVYFDERCNVKRGDKTKKVLKTDLISNIRDYMMAVEGTTTVPKSMIVTYLKTHYSFNENDLNWRLYKGKRYIKGVELYDPYYKTTVSEEQKMESKIRERDELDVINKSTEVDAIFN